MSAAPRRALVLGAGGVLGFAWTLGALSALEAVTGVPVNDQDLVIGTSAGSVGAALLGCGLPLDVVLRHHRGEPDPADPVLRYDHETGAGAALPPRPGWRPASPGLALRALRRPGSVSPLVALSGLLPPGRASLAEVRDLVAGVAAATGHADAWPSAPRPWIVAVDHRTGRRVVFGRTAGSTRAPLREAGLADAVQASCSIPGWFPPTVIDGVPYVDGGALSNASVDLLRGTGVEQVVVVAPMASTDPDHPRAPLARVERRLRRAVTRRILTDAAALRAEGARVQVLTPSAADLVAMGVNMMDAGRRDRVLDTAMRTVTEQLLGDRDGRAATSGGRA